MMPALQEARLAPRPRIAAVILAGGASRRFGSLKQLHRVDGCPLLARVTDVALSSEADEVVVVLGCAAEEIAGALEDRLVRLVVNPAWTEGMASSLRAGLAALAPEVGAALIILGDQVRLTAAEINAVLAGYWAGPKTARTAAATGVAAASAHSDRRPSPAVCPLIIVPTHRGRQGHPVLFARALFPELLALAGDQGGRAVIRRHRASVATVEVTTDGVLADVDTPADLVVG
jgi:molybdenum cofactor cytidylyltransferase